MPGYRKDRGGRYQGKVSWVEGRRKITLTLGTFNTWEEARLAEIEFKIQRLKDEAEKLQAAS